MSRKIGSLIIGLFCYLCAMATLANPHGGNVSFGSVTIHQSGNEEFIHQFSNDAIINWQAFNIAHGQTTDFIQPAGGVTLNRINPANGVSQIYGALDANGTLILVNGA